MTPADGRYRSAVRLCALSLLVAHGEATPQSRAAFDAALEMRGGIVDEVWCERSVLKAVLADVLTETINLFADRLLPKVRADPELGGDLADRMESEFGNILRSTLDALQRDLAPVH